MRKVIIFLLVFVAGQLVAQESPSLRFHIQGYNYVFPGFEVAYEQPLLTKNFGESNRKVQLIAAPSVDFYQYKGNHTGISLNGELNLKYADARGIEFLLFGGYGLLESILSGDVYELDENGEFTSSKLKANLYSQWKSGIGIGKRMNDKPFGVNLRLGVRYAALPAAVIVPNLSIGVNWYFKNNIG